MKINKELKLRINEFEIVVDDWNIENQFFWLRKDNESWSMRLEDIKDLREILDRFEEKLEEDSISAKSVNHGPQTLKEARKENKPNENTDSEDIHSENKRLLDKDYAKTNKEVKAK